MVREVKFSFDEFDERNNPNLTTGPDQLNNNWDDDEADACEDEQLINEFDSFEEDDLEHPAESDEFFASEAGKNPNAGKQKQRRHLADADWMNEKPVDR